MQEVFLRFFVSIGGAFSVYLLVGLFLGRNRAYQAFFSKFSAKNPLLFLDSIKVSPLFERMIAGRWFRLYFSQAGFVDSYPPERFLVLYQVFCCVGLFGAMLSLGLFSSLLSKIVSASACIALAFIVPKLWLLARVKKRSLFAARTLPALIDTLRMQVLAGLNLETAIRTLARHRTDIWQYELERSVFHLDSGLSLVETLARLQARFGAEDVHRFTLAVSQAHTLGASISTILKIQSDTMRLRRKQFAEERARAASVKISVPLVFLIFPALLIVYLAPAIIQVLRLR